GPGPGSRPLLRGSCRGRDPPRRGIRACGARRRSPRESASMPGLTLAICTVKDAVPRLRFQAACAAMRHAADFREHLFLDTPDVRAGYVAYPEYPIATFSAGSLVVYVEGKVY